MAKTGYLIVAHGSSNGGWIKLVDETVEKAQIEGLYKLVFLEMVSERSIADGVKCLAALGVERLVVIPLFISSGSTHIDEIKEIFEDPGISGPHLSLGEAHLMKRAYFCQPLDDHDLVCELLYDRIQELNSCSEPSQQVLLIGHGSKSLDHNKKWHQMLDSLSQKLVCKLSRKAPDWNVTGVTLYDSHLDDNLRNMIKNSDARFNVVPLFLSEGYFTKQVIPKKLQEHISNINYNGKTYLPSEFISKWIKSQVLELSHSLVSDKLCL